MPKQPALPNEQKLIHSSVKHSKYDSPGRIRPPGLFVFYRILH
uniref:Uncharacterized protein n=1 Tax=Myoviridae sp. ctWPU11 TaxID=2825118 RepID=A0A8S5UA91_9CAUD|nr:MAG TPA: hypothetical protein [Myoviridae sp. ctWPU11]